MGKNTVNGSVEKVDVSGKHVICKECLNEISWLAYRYADGYTICGSCKCELEEARKQEIIDCGISRMNACPTLEQIHDVVADLQRRRFKRTKESQPRIREAELAGIEQRMIQRLGRSN